MNPHHKYGKKWILVLRNVACTIFHNNKACLKKKLKKNGQIRIEQDKIK